MKKSILIIVISLFFFKPFMKADEGMWLLPLLDELNIEVMQDMGLSLSAEDIYSINNSSLKDAVVIFGGGCTGEIVSSEGLLLTNHHCGYGAIQSHSTVENDYLSDGFWAMSKKEELPTPGLKVTFLVKMEDVTSSIEKAISEDMSEPARLQKAEAISDSIENAVEDDTGYQAVVRSFFGGNQYFLLVYEQYNDVRLVGTPPSSIGKFGADTDNWMWPRHTGDFSVFRVYMSPDGKPAEYSADNIPLKPKHFFPVSLKGIDEGDFAMILGYPGGTDRYMTSWELKELQQIVHPNRVKIRGIRQELMMEDMLENDKVRIQYSSKYSRSSNYWKFSIGQSQGIDRLNLISKRQILEDEFSKWIAIEPGKREPYNASLDLIKEAVEARGPYKHAVQYINESLMRGIEIVNFALEVLPLRRILENDPGNEEQINNFVSSLKKSSEEFYKDYNPATDKKIASAMIKVFMENVPEENQPKLFEQINMKYKGDYEKYVNKLYSKSIFPVEDEFYDFLDNPDLKKLKKDPVLELALSIYDKSVELYTLSQQYDEKFNKGHRLFIDGLLQMKPNMKFYPDANFSMRLSYGTAGGYFPRDAVYYQYITTLEGVMQKEDPDNWEFEVPAKLKELYLDKDYGRYGEDGEMITCFITNNDITGGNSGSPVLNGNGEIIGLAFDGNWEAMTGDIAFEPELQRTINVDIRYVLFIIDKFAGAKHLVDEMTIIE